MNLPNWLVPIAIELASVLLKAAIKVLRTKADETPEKWDDVLVETVDTIAEYKVEKLGTELNQAGRESIKYLITDKVTKELS